MARFYYRTARIPGGAAGKITGKYEKCVFCNYFDRLFLSGEKKTVTLIKQQKFMESDGEMRKEYPDSSIKFLEILLHLLRLVD